MFRATILFVCLCVTPAWASLLLYDGFEYTADQPLAAYPDPDPDTGNPNGQHNMQYNKYWRYAGSGGTNNAAPKVGSGSLSVPGMPPPAGNCAVYDKTQLAAARIGIPTAPSSGTVYWSGFLKVDGISGLVASTSLSGIMLAGFNNNAGPGGLPSAGGALLLIRKDADDAHWNVGTGATTNNSDRVFATSVPLNPGATVFIVASYTYNPGAHDDVVKMWVNPDASAFGAATEPVETISSTAINGNEPLQAVQGGIASFHLRNVNTVGGADTAQFDELRVGNTWADVTPPAPPPCNDPRFDVDGDSDVDQADFGVWQTCYTGDTGPFDAQACKCMNGNGDTLINADDLAAFTACAILSGPAISPSAAFLACDDALPPP